MKDESFLVLVFFFFCLLCSSAWRLMLYLSAFTRLTLRLHGFRVHGNLFKTRLTLYLCVLMAFYSVD